MKTKFKFLMAAVILAVGFTSCNNEDKIGNGEDTGETTYMTLTITEAKTYATNSDNYGTEDEGNIKTITLFFMKGTSIIQREDLTFNDFDPSTPGTGSDIYEKN